MTKLLSKINQLAIMWSIPLLMTMSLLEIGLRGLEPYNDNIHLLLYNPHILGAYEKIDTLEGLLNTRPKGFQPYAKREGFVLNSKSFRTREYLEDKAPGAYRILAIGDSFTAGSGGVPYSQHWAVSLENYLIQRSIPAELIKLGVGGVGPRFELRLWQLEGSRLHADLVILAFCVGNDLTDEQENTGSFFERMIEISYVLRLARNLYRLTGVTRQILVQESTTQQGGYEMVKEEYDAQKPSFSRQTFLEIVASRMAITYRAHRPLFLTLFSQLKPVLLHFKQSVEHAGAKFLVMLIPDEYQVDPVLRAEVAHQFNHDLQDYEIELPQRELSLFFKEQGILYLDLLPSFRDRAKTTPLYRLQDTHWNIEGNQLASEKLDQFIMAKFFSQHSN